MTKILLVEDDKSLREIYGVRLKAEGYDIVSAGDGEEALAIAIKERPELVVSDVMMPKVSGFDMLDILRSTTETKNIRVIVMTALSSEEQRKRGEMLGADKYLVKSQVGIEDVVRAVHDVLGDGPVNSTNPEPANPFAMPLTPVPPVTPLIPSTAVEQPVTTATSTLTAPAPSVSNPTVPAEQTVVPPSIQPETPQSVPAPAQLPTPVLNNTPPVSPSTLPINPMVAPQKPAMTPTPDTLDSTNNAPNPVSRPGNRVIQPLSDPSQPTFNINSLLDKEFVKETGASNISQPTIMTTAEEQAIVQQQIDNHSNQLLSQAENAQIDTLNNLPNAPITDQPTSTSSENSSVEIDAGAPPANVPSVPLQTREAERVIMPSDKSDEPDNALTGTTLPPTSIM